MILFVTLLAIIIYSLFPNLFVLFEKTNFFFFFFFENKKMGAFLVILHTRAGRQVALDGVAQSRGPACGCVGSYPTKDAHQRIPAGSGIRI